MAKAKSRNLEVKKFYIVQTRQANLSKRSFDSYYSDYIPRASVIGIYRSGIAAQRVMENERKRLDEEFWEQESIGGARVYNVFITQRSVLKSEVRETVRAWRERGYVVNLSKTA